jgi:hypothetical protein
VAETWIQSAVIAVVISSLVTIIGWYISLRHERTLEAERREERIWDYQTALLSDIRSTSAQFAHVNIDRHLSEVVSLIQQAPEDRSYTPFVPRAPGSIMWESIAQEVHILPNEVIDPVVLFFSQLETIRLFVEDLRSERFAQLEKHRKIAMYGDYIRMWKLAAWQAAMHRKRFAPRSDFPRSVAWRGPRQALNRLRLRRWRQRTRMENLHDLYFPVAQ